MTIPVTTWSENLIDIGLWRATVKPWELSLPWQATGFVTSVFTKVTDPTTTWQPS